MTEHIQLQVPEEVRDYHQVLRSSICSLVTECQAREGKTELKALDVGCGRGELLQDLLSLGVSVQGIDMAEECVEISQRFAPARQGDIYELDQLFDDNEFDIVIASHVLEHLQNPKVGVEMLKRQTRSYLILAVPNLGEIRNPMFRSRSDPGYVNRGHQVGWDAKHLNTFLTFACGVKVEKWQPDRVYLPRRIRGLVDKFGLRERLEDSWLPERFPFQSHSLIVLCTT